MASNEQHLKWVVEECDMDYRDIFNDTEILMIDTAMDRAKEEHADKIAKRLSKLKRSHYSKEFIIDFIKKVKI